jgi:hypothetical protein
MLKCLPIKDEVLSSSLIAVTKNVHKKKKIKKKKNAAFQRSLRVEIRTRPVNEQDVDSRAWLR